LKRRIRSKQPHVKAFVARKAAGGKRSLDFARDDGGGVTAQAERARQQGDAFAAHGVCGYSNSPAFHPSPKAFFFRHSERSRGISEGKLWPQH